jgi:hypothetical protein
MPQNRVDWSDPRISAAVYEDMIAVLISRLHPEARRVDGSGGDGGRDVYLPLPSGLVIFEEKSFTGRMRPTRRRQVESSLSNAAAHVPVAWHLVVPIDPNPSELEWFDRVTSKYPFRCDWLGKTWLDGHMADHPELPRYYIEGSADEIVAALLELNCEQACLRGGLPDAVERITALAIRLNELDPHYMFAFSASPVRGVNVEVLPRYPGAGNDRPIRINASFNFPDTEEGRAAAAALNDAVAYGTPSTVSADFVASVTVEGISGLDSAQGAAQLGFGPAQDQNIASLPPMALRLLDEHGAVVVQLPLKVVSRTVGLQGGDVVLTDYAGVVRVTMRFDVPTHRFTLTYEFVAPENALPGVLLPGLRFLCGVTSGLSVEVLIDGHAAGPPTAVPQNPVPELVGYTRLATDLDKIQRKSGVYFPMPSSLSIDEQDHIRMAAQLLAGEVVNGEWTSSTMTMPARSLEGFRELAAGEPRQLWARLPYNLSLEGRDYPIGYVLRTSASARITDWPTISPETSPDAEFEIMLLPGSDNTVTFKLLSAEELEDSGVDNSDANS